MSGLGHSFLPQHLATERSFRLKLAHTAQVRISGALPGCLGFQDFGLEFEAFGNSKLAWALRMHCSNGAPVT